MQNMFNFFLRNVVLVDVRQSCSRIDVIPDLHARTYLTVHRDADEDWVYA